VVNESKSRVIKTNAVQFLGFTFRGTKLRWTDRAFADLKHNARKLTGRSWGVSMAYRLGKLARYVRGWMGYFGISDYYRPIPEVDHWLRRRLRMCYWKQWRRVRTRVRNLLALGTGKRQAILTALSSKSFGTCDAVPNDQRLARTPGPGIRACSVASSPQLRLMSSCAPLL
jgi:RNA-directed DNA polymerase